MNDSNSIISNSADREAYAAVSKKLLLVNSLERLPADCAAAQCRQHGIEGRIIEELARLRGEASQREGARAGEIWEPVSDASQPCQAAISSSPARLPSGRRPPTTASA